MLSKLPRWIWVGVWVLAIVAGMVNVVAILGFDQIPVTHFTGTTSNLGIAIAGGDRAKIVKLIAVIVAFMLGTVLSGFLIKDATLRIGRRYGVALFIESAMLFLAVPFLNHGYAFGIYLLAAASGLQNAMASTYSGSIIRTTHVSGMYTDIGIFMGQRLAGIPADVRRFQLSVIIITGFLLGSIVAGVSFSHLGYDTIFAPAAITGAASGAYSIYRIHQARRAHAELLHKTPEA